LGVARGRSEVDTTWEQLEEFKRRFSEVKLEDELFGGDGGNVVDAFIRKQYQRETAKVSYIRKMIRFLEITLIVSKSDCRVLVNLGPGFTW
jgi:hypothetical protein